MKFRFGHPSIRVYDLEKSLAFYVDALGMKETRRKDFPGDFCLVFLTDENHSCELELTYNYDPKKPYEIGNGFAHLGFYVKDLEAAYDMFKAKGYKVGDFTGLGGNKSSFFFVTDPDGYDVEIIREK